MMDLTIKIKDYSYSTSYIKEIFLYIVNQNPKCCPKPLDSCYLTKKEVRGLIEYLKEKNFKSWVIEDIVYLESRMSHKEKAEFYFY